MAITTEETRFPFSVSEEPLAITGCRREKPATEFELRFSPLPGKLTLDLGQGNFMKAINLRPRVFTPEYALMENVFILSFEASRSR